MNKYIEPSTQIIKVVMPAIMEESNNGAGGFKDPDGANPAPARKLYVG